MTFLCILCVSESVEICTTFPFPALRIGQFLLSAKLEPPLLPDKPQGYRKWNYNYLTNKPYLAGVLKKSYCHSYLVPLLSGNIEETIVHIFQYLYCYQPLWHLYKIRSPDNSANVLQRNKGGFFANISSWCHGLFSERCALS